MRDENVYSHEFVGVITVHISNAHETKEPDVPDPARTCLHVFYLSRVAAAGGLSPYRPWSLHFECTLPSLDNCPIACEFRRPCRAEESMGEGWNWDGTFVKDTSGDTASIARNHPFLVSLFHWRRIRFSHISNRNDNVSTLTSYTSPRKRTWTENWTISRRFNRVTITLSLHLPCRVYVCQILTKRVQQHRKSQIARSKRAGKGQRQLGRGIISGTVLTL